MQHKTDIDDALRAGRVPEIEDAFRALVNWPGEDEIAGLEGMPDAMLLLVATAQRLVDLDDRRAMPGETFDVIRALPHGESLAGGTYAAGAEAVLSDVGSFRPTFERSFAAPGSTMMADEPFSAEVRLCAERARLQAQGDQEKAAIAFACMLRAKPELAMDVSAVIVRSAARAHIWAANGG